jgi:hypothetical protein
MMDTISLYSSYRNIKGVIRVHHLTLDLENTSKRGINWIDGGEYPSCMAFVNCFLWLRMYVQMIEIHSSYHHFDPAHLRMSMSMILPVIRGMLVSTRHLSSSIHNQIAIPTNNLRHDRPWRISRQRHQATA